MVRRFRLNPYPLIIPLFPVLSFILYNLSIVSLNHTFTGILVFIAGLLLAWAAIRFLVKDADRADLIVTALGILFFSFQHLIKAVSLVFIMLNGSTFEAIEKFNLGSDNTEFLNGFMLGWILLNAGILFALLKTKTNLKPISTLLNSFSLIIVALLLVNLVITSLTQRSSTAYQSDWQNMIAALDVETIDCPQDPPDIFYIIPDTYTDDASLHEVFQFENTPFINFLQEKGFEIVENARSNYAQTPLSIASSLNFTYLDEVVSQVGPDSQNRAPLQEMIHNSKLTALLKSCGYKMVAFSSGFGTTDIQSADIYLKPEVEVSDYQSEILNLTPIPSVMNVLSFDDRYQLHRERIQYTLDQLPLVREQYDSPLFVFAHLTAPHHPFVFGAQGEAVNPKKSFSLSEDFRGEGKQEYIEGYNGQLAFINHRLEEILPQIIAQDPQGTVIVLQGDHGSSAVLDWDQPDSVGMRERMSILNAYYLPNGPDAAALENITPVNTFRLILNEYFDAGLPILDNASYFSTLERPYQLQVVK